MRSSIRIRHAYADGRDGLTTTYIVQLYETDPPTRVGTDLAGSRSTALPAIRSSGEACFARSQASRTGKVLRQARTVLNGCRLVVNLTGVMVPEVPLQLEPMLLAMPSTMTLQALKALNVAGVSLANNHTMDLGPEFFDDMRKALADANIATITQGGIVDFGAFRLTALTDLDNRSLRTEGVIAPGDIARLAASDAKPPVFAMINWGTDYVNRPGPRQIALRSDLLQSAVSLVIGVHPHSASAGLDLLEGGGGLSVHALGNFIFDQTAPVASGSILEVRVFDGERISRASFRIRIFSKPHYGSDENS